MYIVENLKQDTEYTIRVAAVTSSGSGNIYKISYSYL